MPTANGQLQLAKDTAAQIDVPYWATYVRLANLGGNVVYIASNETDCTAAKGNPVAATTGVVELFYVAGSQLWAITTANQTSPADLRWFAAG